jgi:hypothetical protein
MVRSAPSHLHGSLAMASRPSCRPVAVSPALLNCSRSAGLNSLDRTPAPSPACRSVAISASRSAVSRLSVSLGMMSP